MANKLRELLDRVEAEHCRQLDELLAENVALREKITNGPAELPNLEKFTNGPAALPKSDESYTELDSIYLQGGTSKPGSPENSQTPRTRFQNGHSFAVEDVEPEESPQIEVPHERRAPPLLVSTSRVPPRLSNRSRGSPPPESSASAGSTGGPTVSAFLNREDSGGFEVAPHSASEALQGDPRPVQKVISQGSAEESHAVQRQRRRAATMQSAMTVGSLIDFDVKDAWKNRMFDFWGENVSSFMSLENLRPIEKQVAITPNGKDAFPVPPIRAPIFVIPPNSTFRITWDLIGMLLIGYDVLAIPFTQAFNPDPVWLMIGMDYIALSFWTMDMFQAFFLGYYDRGRYVTDHRRILYKYVTTWFFIDLIVIGPEWLTIFDGNTNSFGAPGRMLKGARAIRVLRLLRLLKLQRIINMLYDMIESEYTFILVNLAKLLVSVLILNHVIACVWYLLGRVTSERGQRNWIEEGKITEDSEMAYRYTTSLHWSLTQFTPASMDISARNTPERVFSIVVLFFAMVAFSSIIGSISGSMTSLRNMKNDEMKQFWLLRRYLRQRNISSGLSGRIIKYLEHQSSKQSTMVQASSIRIMSGLSEALQNELTYQLYSPVLLGKHIFFDYLDNEMQAVMHRLCRFVLKAQSFAEGEVTFVAGEEARKMFFIKSGELRYIGLSGDELQPPPQVNEGVSEAVLWCVWRHCGDFVAFTTSELLVCDPASFVDVMSLHPRPWFYAKRYAEQFIEFVNTMDTGDLSDIIRNDNAVGCMVKEAIRTEKGVASELNVDESLNVDIPSTRGAS